MNFLCFQSQFSADFTNFRDERNRKPLENVLKQLQDIKLESMQVINAMQQKMDKLDKVIAEVTLLLGFDS